MTDLAEFLLARITEDEAAAKSAAVLPPRAVPPPEAVTSGPFVRAGEWGWGGGSFRPLDDPVTSAALGLADSDSPYYVTAADGWDESEPTGARYDVATVPNDHDAARHIARWDPARVLAECEAKRQIVERCAAVDFAMPSTHLAHGVLALLALPYADHPDYRDEWRP